MIRETIKETKELFEEQDYRDYFNKKLKKWKIKSPNELSPKDKKAFYDECDKDWKADNETDKD